MLRQQIDISSKNFKRVQALIRRCTNKFLTSGNRLTSRHKGFEKLLRVISHFDIDRLKPLNIGLTLKGMSSCYLNNMKSYKITFLNQICMTLNFSQEGQ